MTAIDRGAMADLVRAIMRRTLATNKPPTVRELCADLAWPYSTADNRLKQARRLGLVVPVERYKHRSIRLTADGYELGAIDQGHQEGPSKWQTKSIS